MTTKTSLKPGTKSSAPVCWWCGIRTAAETGYRGEQPDVVPFPAGVVVCTPGCPQRPEGARVWAAHGGAEA